MKDIPLQDVALNDYDQIIPLVVGLLNCGGGVIDLGRSRNEEEVKNLESEFYSTITPQAPIFLREIGAIGELKNLKVEVPAGYEPPYAYKNVIFAIDGMVCAPATVDQIRDWVLSNSDGFNRWENRSCICDNEEEMIDRVAINEAAREVNKTGRMSIDPNLSTKELLAKFTCCRYDRLLNAGVVLFGKLPGRYAPQTQIRLTHFAGVTHDSRIIASKVYDGPLATSIDSIVNYIIDNSPQVTTFDRSTGNRHQSYVYPPAVVREAIVNACAHRDYASAFGGVKISLFSNRLEVWNSGQLPKGVTVAALNKGSGVKSVLVNPTISAYLYARGYMERDGRGSSLMPKQSYLVGTTVRWSADLDSGVTVVLRHKLIEASEQSPIMKKVLDIIAENPGLRKPQLMELVGLKRSSLQRALDLLRAEGKIEFSGGNKNGGYYLRDGECRS